MLRQRTDCLSGTLRHLAVSLTTAVRQNRAHLMEENNGLPKILETYEPGDAIVKKAGELLLSALREAEEHYIAAAETQD